MKWCVSPDQVQQSLKNKLLKVVKCEGAIRKINKTLVVLYQPAVDISKPKQHRNNHCYRQLRYDINTIVITFVFSSCLVFLCLSHKITIHSATIIKSKNIRLNG